MLSSDEVKAILSPQFGLLGKSIRGEPLWVHAFTLWSITYKILKFIPRFTDAERRLLEIATLIHDIGKMSEKNQEILSGNVDGKVKHTQSKAQIDAYLRENQLIEALSLNESDIDFIYHANLHHDLPKEALKTAPPAMGVDADIVRFPDWLASQSKLDRKLIRRISLSLEPFCQITVVQISRIEGPSNYLLFDTAYNIYKEKGWDLLLVLPDGLLLIAPKNAPYPEKSCLIQNYQHKIIMESILTQKPNLTNFAAVFLAGESAKNPGIYLEVHKDAFLEALGDFERAPLYFFKILIELLDSSGKLSVAMREKYFILDILKGLTGPHGIPKARKKWNELGGKIFEPLKDMLKEMFDIGVLKQVVPDEILEQEEPDKKLKDISAAELHELLYQIAERLFPRKIDIYLQNELESLINMEEEVNFREIALKRFKQYKEYKTYQNPEKGICESCGSTLAFPTQKSLNFPGGKRWGFSQINAHTDSARATCTLCAFDTMVLRRDVPESRNPIYVRLESKSHDIWQLYDEIAVLIQRLEAAFYNPYMLETLDKSKDYGFLPLPKDFKVPKFREPRYHSQSLISVRGCLIPLTRVDGSESPKDLKAKYMSLYALLIMMGFYAHIGFEEQDGLFGDKDIAKHGEKYESFYYRGLAIKYFAKLLGGEKKEKQNAHVLAESILTKSPSVAITKIGDAVSKEEMKNKIGKEQMLQIMEAIVKGNFKIKVFLNGGEYTMKELLQDAEFFAEGIPAFIWSGDDHKSWITNSSKHLIAKPISKTMNSVLQGDDFETAFAKYLSLIKEDISSDKTKEGSLAKVDISDLSIFVEKSREILKRYYELRQEDISSFIQAKNALLSSVYILKRYPNIKEVVNG